MARYFRFRDTEEFPEDELAKTLAPMTLARQDAGSIWKDSVDLAAELSIIDRRNGKILLSSPFWADIASDDLEGIQRGLRRVIMAEAQNDGLWDETQGGWSAEGSREFSRIATWVLQVPLRDLASPERPVDSLARRAVEGPKDAKLVENPEQWRVFERWASALGLVSALQGRTLPDPTQAVRQEVRPLLEGESEVASMSVRAGLIERLPVLQHGAYANGLDDVLREPPMRDTAAAGVGLSVALSRLRRAGRLEFVSRSDGDRLILGDEDDHPTHLKWLAT